MCTLNKYADDIKLRDAADTIQGSVAIQKDLDKLEKLIHVNPVRYNNAKCKVVHLVWGSPDIYTDSEKNSFRVPCRVGLGNPGE